MIIKFITIYLLPLFSGSILYLLHNWDFLTEWDEIDPIQKNGIGNGPKTILVGIENKLNL
jgi:hypothetical protein